MKIPVITSIVALVVAIASGAAVYQYNQRSVMLLVPLDIPDLKTELTQGQYNKVTKRLEDLQQKYERRHDQEDYIVKAISKLMPRDEDSGTEDPEFTALLKDWEHNGAHSYVPYLVQCDYFNRVAWDRRGGGWASETSAQQFAEMRHFMEMSDKKCEFALTMNPRLSLAYANLISNALARSMRDRISSLLRRARKNLKASYWVDLAFLRSLQPKWGGSIRQMEAFVNEATSGRNDDVFARRLKGRLLYLKVEAGSDPGKLHVGLEMMNEAIELYPSQKHLEHRAWIHGKLGQYEKSIADLRRVLERYPKAEWTNQYLARNYRWLAQYEDSIQQWNRVISWYGDKPKYLAQRGYVYWDLGDYDNAEADLLKAIEIDPDDHEIWTELGKLYNYALKDPEKADAAINRAIEIDPTYRQAYFEAGSNYYWSGDKRANQYLRQYLFMCSFSNDCKKEHVHFAEEFFECLEPDSGCSWSEVDKENFL